MIASVVWKEYRSQRWLWLVIAGLGLALQILASLSSSPVTDHAAILGIALATPLGFTLASTCILFAGDVEDGAFGLLRMVPVSRLQFIATKLGFSLVAALGMGGFLLLSATLMPGYQWGDVEIAPAIYPTAVATLVGLTLIGAFFSIITQRVLLSIVLTVVASVMTYGTIAASRNSWHMFAVFVLLATSADVILGHRLFANGSLALRRPAWLDFRKRRGVVLEALIVRGDSANAAWRAYRRLLWQEWRQARLGVLWVVFTVAVVFLTADPQIRSLSTDVASLLLALSPVMLGVWSFRGEQRHQRFRFHAHVGNSTIAVWSAKQLCWAGLLGILVLCTTLIAAMTGVVGEMARMQPWDAPLTQSGWSDHSLWRSILNVHERSVRTGASTVGYFLAYVGIGYSSGQLASVVLPRSITAAFAAGLLSLLGYVWMMLMNLGGVPLSWTIAPVIMVMFVASLIFCRGWMLERTSWRSWTATVGVLVLGMAVAFGQMVSHRLTGEFLPKAVFVAENNLVKIDPLFRGNLLVRPARDRWRSGLDASSVRPSVAGRPSESLYERAYDIANADAKKLQVADEDAVRGLLLDAAEEEPGPGIGSSEINGIALDRMSQILRRGAARCTERGELNRAFEHIIAHVRMTAHYAGQAQSPDQWASCADLYAGTGDGLDAWMRHEDQTADRIRNAISVLQEEHDRFPNAVSSVIAAAQSAHDLIDLDFAGLKVKSYRMRKYRIDMNDNYHLLIATLPWERQRARQLVDVCTEFVVQSLTELESTLENSGASVLSQQAHAAPTHSEFRTQVSRLMQATPLNEMLESNAESYDVTMVARVAMEVSHRGLLYQLAFAAFQIENDRLPGSLEELDAAKYLSALPQDPWTGGDFGYAPSDHRFAKALVRVVGAPSGRSPDEHYKRLEEPFVWSTGPLNVHFLRLADGGQKRTVASSSGQQTVVVNPYYQLVTGDGGGIGISHHARWPMPRFVIPVRRSAEP